MNKPFIVEQTKKTPFVHFDPNVGKLEISGYSLPTNSQEFYEPLFREVEKYLESPQPATELVFNIIYFNTSSSKLILHLLLKFETLISMGKEVTLNWYVDEEDIDMYDAGKTYQASIKIPTSIIGLRSE